MKDTKKSETERKLAEEELQKSEELFRLTERMRWLEALEESEKRYRSMIQSTPDAVIVADGEGKIVTME